MSKLLQLFHITTPQNRIYGLDILRALAILFVVIGHGNMLVPQEHHLAFIFQLFVFDGVSVFFVLSGFLIGGILIKILEKGSPTFLGLFDFWKKRWFRTLPNYYFILFFLFLTIPFNHVKWIINPFEGHFFINYLFFLQNFNTPIHNFFPESWSLCIEEWFYLIVPLLIFIVVGVFKVTPKKGIMAVALFIIIAVTLFRYYRFTHLDTITQGVIDSELALQVVTRLDSLMFGMIGAFMSFYYKNTWVKGKLLLLILGIVILCVQKYLPLIVDHQLGIYDGVFTYSITSLGTLLLMPFMSEYKIGSGLLYKSLTYISLISYSMYLLNLSPVIYTSIPFITFFIKGIRLFSVVRYLLYWLLTIGGAVILYKCIEMPFMRLRNRNI